MHFERYVHASGFLILRNPIGDLSWELASYYVRVMCIGTLSKVVLLRLESLLTDCGRIKVLPLGLIRLARYSRRRSTARCVVDR